MDKHFELTDKFIINAFGAKLFQIKCTRKIKYADIGDLGGYIEKEDNLYGDAWVFGYARVFGDARVSGDAQVSGNAQVYGDAQVFGDAQVSGNAQVSGYARVFGDARVSNDNEHCGFDCFGSANRHTHSYKTKSGKIEITCGCFRGSIEEFEKQIKETHRGNEFERQYMAIVEVIKIKFGLK